MDYGSWDTDMRVYRLEKRIKEVYSEASKDIDVKMKDFNDRYKIKEAMYKKQVKDGKITQDDFDAWKRGQVFQGQQWEAKKASIEDTLTHANETALRMVNGEKTKVFMANSNYQAYQLEHSAGVDFGFNLYDSATVARLIEDQPNLLPFPSINVPKDKMWNSRNISRQIAQGIIQGESLDKIAKRLSRETGSKNMNSMLTNARTAMTGAQNAGRIVRLNEAKNKGIKVKKEWMATLDEHTRWQHADLDGQKVDTDKPFKVGGYTIMYPGDPHAHPSMIYNCRCTLVGDLEDYPSEYERYDNIDGKPIKNMTYREWEKAKGVQYSKSQASDANFFILRKSLGDGFVDAMETLLNFTQEEDVKDLFYAYMDRLRVTDPSSQDGAYFSPTDGGVHINSNKVQQGDNLHVPYQTAFHEFGHNIDNLASSKGYGDNWLSRDYKNGLLSKKLKEDWQDFRVKYLLSHTDEWAKEDYSINTILRGMARKDNKDDYGNSMWYKLVMQHRHKEITREEILSKYGEKMAREYLTDKRSKYFTDHSIIKMLENENMPLHARGSISDTIGGLMCARGENEWRAYPLGAGHQFDYWWKYKRTKGNEYIKVSSENQPLEFFAEVLDAKAANPESLVQMRRIFPKSVKVVEQIIQEALKK